MPTLKYGGENLKRLSLILSLFFLLSLNLYIDVDGQTEVSEGRIDKYQLVVNVSPPSIATIDGSDFYEKNTWIQTGKAPVNVGPYDFIGWNVDDALYPGNPISILMDKDHTATAVYSIHPDKSSKITDDDLINQGSNKYRLTIISPYGLATGGGLYDEGEIAKLQISERFVYDDFRVGIRYVFTGWDKGTTPNLMNNSIFMDESITVGANWMKQYRLDLTNTVSNTKLMGEGWYDENSMASIVASSDSKNGKTKDTLKGWVNAGQNVAIIEDPYSHVTSIVMKAPYTVTVEWKTQFYLDAYSAYGAVEGEGYYDEGMSATVSIDSEVVTTGRDGVRMMFDGWDGDTISEGMNAKVLMDGPKSVTPNWNKQYYLTVNSEYGIPNGSGWYDEGQAANFGINVSRDPAGFWKQQIFHGWDGSFSSDLMTGAILMNGPKTATAKWQEDNSIAYLNIGIIFGVAIIGSISYKIIKKKIPNNSQSIVEQKET